MNSLHRQTSLQTQISHAYCTFGKTSTSVDIVLCLRDNFSLPRSLTFSNTNIFTLLPLSIEVCIIGIFYSASKANLHMSPTLN